MCPPELKWLKGLGLNVLYNASQDQNEFEENTSDQVCDFIKKEVCQEDKQMDENIKKYFSSMDFKVEESKLIEMRTNAYLDNIQDKLKGVSMKDANEKMDHHMFVLVGVMVTMYGYTTVVDMMKKIPDMHVSSWVCV